MNQRCSAPRNMTAHLLGSTECLFALMSWQMFQIHAGRLGDLWQRNSPVRSSGQSRTTKGSLQPRWQRLGTGPNTPMSPGCAPASPLLRKAFL
jgi:hypothetical protein